MTCSIDRDALHGLLMNLHLCQVRVSLLPTSLSGGRFASWRRTGAKRCDAASSADVDEAAGGVPLACQRTRICWRRLDVWTLSRPNVPTCDEHLDVTAQSRSCSFLSVPRQGLSGEPASSRVRGDGSAQLCHKGTVQISLELAVTPRARAQDAKGTPGAMFSSSLEMDRSSWSGRQTRLSAQSNPRQMHGPRRSQPGSVPRRSATRAASVKRTTTVRKGPVRYPSRANFPIQAHQSNDEPKARPQTASLCLPDAS